MTTAAVVWSVCARTAVRTARRTRAAASSHHDPADHSTIAALFTVPNIRTPRRASSRSASTTSKLRYGSGRRRLATGTRIVRPRVHSCRASPACSPATDKRRPIVVANVWSPTEMRDARTSSDAPNAVGAASWRNVPSTMTTSSAALRASRASTSTPAGAQASIDAACTCVRPVRAAPQTATRMARC